MKSILLSGTAALLLVAASGAYAQPDQHQNDNHAGDQHGTAGDHGNNGFDHGSNGPANNTTTTHTTTHRTHTPHHTMTHSTTTTTTNDNNHSNNGFDHNGNNNHDNNDHNNNGHDNGHPHAQISVNLKITVNATHHFRGPAWHAPRGYVYRRYTVGGRMEQEFYARDYWLTDYSTYDLIAPPDGYTWVRFGPDAILIDEDTGEVVRVEYGVFTG